MDFTRDYTTVRTAGQDNDVLAQVAQKIWDHVKAGNSWSTGDRPGNVFRQATQEMVAENTGFDLKVGDIVSQDWNDTGDVEDVMKSPEDIRVLLQRWFGRELAKDPMNSADEIFEAYQG